MATPPCMSDDGNPAVFVGTMLATGDAVALCDECLVSWTAALLNVMTGVDPTPFLAAIGEPDSERVALTEDGEQHASDVDELPPRPPTRIAKAGRTLPGSPDRGTAGAPPGDGPPTAQRETRPAA